MREFARPELVAWVLDEFDEGHEQAPGVRPIDNETLQQHTGDLLLHHLLLTDTHTGLTLTPWAVEISSGGLLGL